MDIREIQPQDDLICFWLGYGHLVWGKSLFEWIVYQHDTGPLIILGFNESRLADARTATAIGSMNALTMRSKDPRFRHIHYREPYHTECRRAIEGATPAFVKSLMEKTFPNYKWNWWNRN